MHLGKKIMIIGSGGSGKSTLARQLGEITGLPVVHLDKEFWNPGWEATPENEWAEKQIKLVSAKKWIIDGNYAGSLELRLEKADTVIFLDFNRYVCIYSAVKRRVSYRGKTRPDIAKGCPEKIDFEFIRWMWSFPKKTRQEVLKKISQFENVNSITFNKRNEVKQFLEKMWLDMAEQ